MAFVDEITIRAKAGKGGNGIVSWLHLKGKEFAGPSGGDGGHGGDVFVRGVRDIGRLASYRNIKEFFAEDGESGKSKTMRGADGEDLYLEIPVGGVVTNKDTDEQFEILEEGQEFCVLKGGEGGFGNDHFKSSKNVTPRERTLGKEGETGLLYIELRLMADFGLVGLPNAGKSSLINVLTNAKSKVASYQFTTLEPYLGDMHGYIIADIPGLIEGASENKGLGHAFLRHIRRTKVILHCLPLDSADILHDYKSIRAELEKYDKELSNKKEVILLTKADLVELQQIQEAKDSIQKINPDIIEVSILDDDSIKDLRQKLISLVS